MMRLSFAIAVVTTSSSVFAANDDLKSKMKKLEERLSAIEAKMAEAEKDKTICLNEKKAAQAALADKEQDIKDCAAHLNFKGSHEERNIGFSVLEIFKGGCLGHAKMNLEKYRGENQLEKSESNYDGPVMTKMGGMRGGPGSFVIEKIEKKINDQSSAMHRSPFENEIDLKLRDYENKEFTSVILGKMYEINFTRSGGTLGKGVYSFKYNVTQNKNAELIVNLEANRAEQWTHMPVGEKSKAKLTLTCKSLKQLNELAKNSPETKINDDISKKIFGP